MVPLGSDAPRAAPVTEAKRDPIRIVFCAEGTYIPHAAAMLDSLISANPGESFELSLLQGPDMDVAESQRLEQWLADKRQPLRRITLDPAESIGKDFRSPFFHRSIWYRVLLPGLLPQVPKVLYLDADTLVVDRIRPLWETDLAGHLFGAVVNPLYPTMPNWPVEKLGLPTRQRYLNSGVLLLDLDAMRREGCVQAVRDYASSSPGHYGHAVTEQDALAALYHNRCLFLHPRWNMQTTFFELGLADIPARSQDVVEARRKPAIVHFIGAKPSHYLCRHPYRSAYLRHRLATPWPLASPEGRNPVNFFLRQLPTVWLWRAVALRNRLLPPRPGPTSP